MSVFDFSVSCTPAIRAGVSGLRVVGRQLTERCTFHSDVLNSILSWCTGTGGLVGPPGQISCNNAGNFVAPSQTDCMSYVQIMNKAQSSILGTRGSLSCLDTQLVALDICGDSSAALNELGSRYISNWTLADTVACSALDSSTTATSFATVNSTVSMVDQAVSTEDTPVFDTAEIVVTVAIVAVLFVVIIYVMCTRRKNEGADLVSSTTPVIPFSGKFYSNDDTVAETNVDHPSYLKALPANTTHIDGITNPNFESPFDQNGIYNYRITNLRVVMPFSSQTAYKVLDLTLRSKVVQQHEFLSVSQLCQSYLPNQSNPKFIDDYGMGKGIVLASGKLSWHAVWTSASSVIVVLPARNEVSNEVALPSPHESMRHGMLTITTKHILTAPFDNVTQYSVTLTQGSGEQRAVTVIQPSTWSDDENAITSTLIEMMAAANRTRRPGTAVFLLDSAFTIPSDATPYQLLRRPTAGVFLMSWICAAQALDTGLIDQARTLLLLRAQDVSLVTDELEYDIVQKVLTHMLISIPIMEPSLQSASQRFITSTAHSWHSAVAAQILSTPGYLDENGSLETCPEGESVQLVANAITGHGMHLPSDSSVAATGEDQQ